MLKQLKRYKKNNMKNKKLLKMNHLQQVNNKKEENQDKNNLKDLKLPQNLPKVKESKINKISCSKKNQKSKMKNRSLLMKKMTYKIISKINDKGEDQREVKLCKYYLQKQLKTRNINQKITPEIFLKPMLNLQLNKPKIKLKKSKNLLMNLMIFTFQKLIYLNLISLSSLMTPLRSLLINQNKICSN